jgi:tetrahydromethanopterin S-methyltransferase subunit B
VATNLEALSYDLALRSLDHQERTLEELRGRTGTLLTAAALTTSFLGARALAGDADHALATVGFGFAIVSIVISVYVLAPKAVLEFAISGSAIYDYFAREQADFPEAQRTLAQWAQYAWDSNQDVIDRLVVAFQAACAALVGAVAVWCVALALH